MIEYPGLVSGKELRKALLRLKNPFFNTSVYPESVNRYVADGWEVERVFKTKTRLKKPKPFDQLFEENVWVTMYSMGFSNINKDRSFKVYFEDSNNLSQQIDVFAEDEDVVLIIECKASKTPENKQSLKKDIEAFSQQKSRIQNFIRKHSQPGTRAKFIFATRNFVLSENDRSRLVDEDIYHLDDTRLTYFEDLTKHLGSAARYQFLGSIFEGREIPGLDVTIPAVSGKIGGHSFFSFSIEPSTLLKFSYILHRNDANSKDMPTYQRMIRKSRLTSISKFINGGGYFPNSIIINIDNNGKDLNFDLSSLQSDNTISRIGILHLPKRYRSAYIIDGQHRLYGYVNTQYRSTNTVPVVAFVNLEQSEQLKLFMEINENQKSVPKNLRNTLEADLSWHSESLKRRIGALETRLSERLGTDTDSPLYNKILIGENPQTATKSIRLESIKKGLSKGNFIGKADDSKLIRQGSFFAGTIEATYEKLYPFLLESLIYVKQNSKGLNQGELFTTNPGIESLIAVIGDVVDTVCKAEAKQVLTCTTDELVHSVSFYLDPLLLFIDEMPESQRLELSKYYGAGGPIRYQRTWQREIYNARHEFKPNGLEEYWKEHSAEVYQSAVALVKDIETTMKKEFKLLLTNKFGDRWFILGLPKNVYDEANKLASDKNYEEPDQEIDPWDCIDLIDYRKIALNGGNWGNIFEKRYTYPPSIKGNASKADKTSWIDKLNRIRNTLFHRYSIKEEDFDFLKQLALWIKNRDSFE